MAIYIFLILEVIVMGFLYGAKKIDKKLFFILIGITLIIISGLRKTSIGLNDTEKVYLPSFHLVANTSWKYLFDLQHRGISNLDNTGFLIFMKVISTVWNNDNFFIFVTSCPYIICFLRFVYKYSKAPVLSIMVFLALNLYIGTFYLIRHTVAATFLLIGLEALLKDDNKKYILFTILATTMHTSAIVFFLLYPLKKVKISFKYQICILFGSLVIGQYGLNMWQQVATLVSRFVPTFDRYIYHSIGEFGQSWFIGAAIIMLSFLSYKKMQYIDQNTDFFQNLSLLASVCYGLMPLLNEFSRIAMYFAVGFAVILPNTLHCVTGKLCRVGGYVAVIVLFTAYFIYLLPGKQMVPYKFFFD